MYPTSRRQAGIALMAGGFFCLFVALLYVLPFAVAEMAPLTLTHARIVELCLCVGLASYGAGWAFWRGK